MTAKYPALWLLMLSVTLAQPVWSDASPVAPTISWQRIWSDELFAQARLQDKFVLLDLEAVWCHWCHVMEQTTYHDDTVMELLAQHFITVRIDQDSAPHLLARYGDWGWPATIVFSADGQEIVKRRGYINPVAMASMLQAIIDDPSPGPSVISRPPVKPSATPGLSKDQWHALLQRYLDLYDAENGGWGFIHKFINADAMDYALSRAQRGEKLHEIMALQTLHAALSLIDPVWGGVYQYSDKLDWSSPHYEKIMSSQTDYLRLYSLAWSLWGQENHRRAADRIYSYLNRFLKSPDGLFFTSQDADLSRQVDGKRYYQLAEAERLALGAPRIDRNIYTRENAWIIRAFVAYANATGTGQALDQAAHIAQKMEQLMGSGDGGFRHAVHDETGPYLPDTLAMVRAYLALYQASGGQSWLKRVRHGLEFIERNFRHPQAGYVNSRVTPSAVGVFKTAVRQRDENIQLARAANLAAHIIGDGSLLDIFDHAMRYLTSDDVIEDRFFLPGLLLAADERSRSPIHITVVGDKDDPLAAELHAEARRYPVDFLQVDWWDRREGPLMNNKIQYPRLSSSAAFACSEDSCSLPIFDVSELHAQVDRLLNPPALH